ncbi:hypothetical protein BDV93DRAFT_399372, partial [Ceratobasidium sp. AG-I]
AIQDVQASVSLRDAAKQRNLPKSTFDNRLKGRQGRHLAHEDDQLLSRGEETELVDLCRKIEQCFLPVRISHIVACAKMILSKREGSEDVHIGDHWAERFLHRHPELKLTTSKRINL